MLIDSQLSYSDAQALAGNAASTNVVDHGQDRDIGIGEPMAVVLTVDVAQAGGGNFQVSLQSDSVVGFGSVVTVYTTGIFTALTQGQRLILPIPADFTWNRFSRLNYTLSAGTITVTAELQPLRMVQADQYGPSGFTVQ